MRLVVDLKDLRLVQRFLVPITSCAVTICRGAYIRLLLSSVNCISQPRVLTWLEIHLTLSAAGRSDMHVPTEILQGHKLLTNLFPLTRLHLV